MPLPTCTRHPYVPVSGSSKNLKNWKFGKLDARQHAYQQICDILFKTRQFLFWCCCRAIYCHFQRFPLGRKLLSIQRKVLRRQRRANKSLHPFPYALVLSLSRSNTSISHEKMWAAATVLSIIFCRRTWIWINSFLPPKIYRYEILTILSHLNPLRGPPTPKIVVFNNTMLQRTRPRCQMCHRNKTKIDSRTQRFQDSRERTRGSSQEPATPRLLP